ncbi:protein TRIGALACTOSYLDIACYLGLYCEROL 4, chloroplastic-like [Bidens hawaiensis]|uniref:protein TRIGALACTOSYLDIACYLGLYCEROL 4, chloroplastic-like n=1 Tax=Bidens hawaiensis TaxID=980011 RepID=UPI004048FEAB
MRKLRWVRDGDGLWDLDVSTPSTLNGVARPVPSDPIPSVLGLSRGIRLSRPKQVDFFQRFMFMPFVPSYSRIHPSPNTNGGGLCLQRVVSLGIDRWLGTVLGQFNIQKLVSNIKKNGFRQPTCESPWFQSVATHLRDKSLYALDFCSEFFLTPDDTLLLSLESYGHDDYKTPRKKAVFHHQFPHHNLTLEAASPGLFVDKDGTFWDVPLTMALDLASVASSDNGPSYHICINHNDGPPKEFGSHKNDSMVASLQPGLSATTAFSFKNSVDVWRSEAPKLKMVQPYDVFLSDPHISATGVIGGVLTACFGENSVRAPPGDDGSCRKGFGLGVRRGKCAVLADSFVTLSLSAQYGTFQKMFLDLTRFQAVLDFPSGSTFFSGAARLAKDVYNSRPPNLEAIQEACPNATLSFQQQLAGPFSFRVDSEVELDLKSEKFLKVKDPVVAVEYALQVLGSAKAVAWYSPRQQEFMMELRFFES